MDDYPAAPKGMHPASVPYWRAGLRWSDADICRRIAAEFVREQRNESIRVAVRLGNSQRKVAQMFGLSPGLVSMICAEK